MILFLVAAHAETKRAPFDTPEGDSEIIGYFLEYSGLKCGMFLIAEYAETVVIAGIVTAIFLGGYHVPWLEPTLAAHDRRVAGRQRRGLARGLPGLRLPGEDAGGDLDHVRGALDLSPLPLRPDHAPGLEDDAARLARERGRHRRRPPPGRPRGAGLVGIVEWVAILFFVALSARAPASAEPGSHSSTVAAH